VVLLDAYAEGFVVAETRPDLLSTAETAECTCPEFCERDHETD
jgi:hypothetical protein